MAYYALQATYSPLGWSAMLKSPQHRLEAIRPVVERLQHQHLEHQHRI
jgi:hypothetical protein